MRRAQMGLAAGILLMLGFAGCSSTIQGANQDAARDVKALGTATKEAGQAMQNEGQKTEQNAKTDVANVKAAAKNSTSAATVTPVVKMAIIADAVLNDKRNHINVDTANGVVKLLGHVTSQSSKQRASEDAEKALSNEHVQMQVKNELAIQP